MIQFYDCKNRLVCKGDPVSGFVESIYKGHKTSTFLEPGEVFVIERQGVVTNISRTTDKKFVVESYSQAL